MTDLTVVSLFDGIGGFPSSDTPKPSSADSPNWNANASWDSLTNGHRGSQAPPAIGNWVTRLRCRVCSGSPNVLSRWTNGTAHEPV